MKAGASKPVWRACSEERKQRLGHLSRTCRHDRAARADAFDAYRAVHDAPSYEIAQARAALANGSCRIALRLNLTGTDCARLQPRPRCRGKAQSYAAAMTGGTFGLPPSAIRVWRGLIHDGNHRIAAMRHHGATIPRVVLVIATCSRSRVLDALVSIVLAEQRRELEGATREIDLSPAALAVLEREVA